MRFRTTGIRHWAKSEIAAKIRKKPVLVAVDLGAESCRVSLLRWIEGQPEIRLIHRFANSACK